MTEQDLLDLYKEAHQQMKRKYGLPNDRGIGGMFEDMGLSLYGAEFVRAAFRYFDAYEFLQEAQDD